MMNSRQMTLSFLLTVLIAGITSFAAAQDQPAEKPSQEELEAEFAKKMSGVTLVGYFTIDGQQRPPREERYDISKATKVKDNQWLIQARIKYGDKDLTVPVPLYVDWAGDTPVMSLTDLAIPGLGTFTSRTMVYGDRYVGTWQHGKVGGHMYGRLERTEKEGEE